MMTPDQKPETVALTLRLPAALHEEIRQEAFDRRVAINHIIREALIHRRPAAEPGPGACDVCGKPRTLISTPGGFRFCDDHKPNKKS